MDEIFKFEDYYGGEIKVKKIIVIEKSSVLATDVVEKEIWQIFNPDTNRWEVIKHKRLIDHYKLHFVQERYVIVEKVLSKKSKKKL